MSIFDSKSIKRVRDIIFSVLFIGAVLSGFAYLITEMVAHDKAEKELAWRGWLKHTGNPGKLTKEEWMTMKKLDIE